MNKCLEMFAEIAATNDDYKYCLELFGRCFHLDGSGSSSSSLVCGIGLASGLVPTCVAAPSLVVPGAEVSLLRLPDNLSSSAASRICFPTSVSPSDPSEPTVVPYINNKILLPPSLHDGVDPFGDFDDELPDYDDFPDVYPPSELDEFFDES